MAILKTLHKKTLKGSSLTEVLIASVIILTVFGIAIATLDNVLFSSIKNKSSFIKTELNQLVYQYKHGALKLPYASEEEKWTITTIKTSENNIDIVIFQASNSETKQKISKKSIVYEAQ